MKSGSSLLSPRFAHCTASSEVGSWRGQGLGSPVTSGSMHVCPPAGQGALGGSHTLGPHGDGCLSSRHLLFAVCDFQVFPFAPCSPFPGWLSD